MILAGGGVLRARTSTELLRFAELLRVPVIAALAPGGRHLERPSALPRAWPATAARPSVRERLDSRRRASSSSAAGSTRPPRSATRSPPRDQRWMHVDIEPRTGRRACRRPALGIALGCAGLPRGRRRPAARRGRPRRRASPTPGRANADATARPGKPPRSSTTTPWDGPGVHPGRVVATLRRLLPDDAILDDRRRQLRPVGRPRLPVPPARHVPRPDVGRDGLRPAGRDRGGARPSRSARRRDRRRRRPRDDDGRARDRGPREGQGRSSSCFDNERYGTIRMHQERRGTRPGRRDRARPDRLRGDRPRRRRARAPRRARRRRSSRRCARRSPTDRPTVIQVALDRRWVSVDEPATRRLMRHTFHLTPVETWATRPAPPRPLEAPSLAAEGFIHCTDGADGAGRDGQPPLRDDPRAFVALTRRPRPPRSRWSIEDPRASTRTSSARSTAVRCTA